MIFQYQEEDSGSLCKCTDSPDPSLHRKNREEYSFLDVISLDYDNIAAAVLRHAEFS